jgi:hypothetical protein
MRYFMSFHFQQEFKDLQLNVAYGGFIGNIKNLKMHSLLALAEMINPEEAVDGKQTLSITRHEPRLVSLIFRQKAFKCSLTCHVLMTN